MSHTGFIDIGKHFVVVTSDIELGETTQKLRNFAQNNQNIELFIQAIQENVRTIAPQEYLEVTIVKKGDNKPLLLAFNTEGNLERAERLYSGNNFDCTGSKEEKIISAIDEYVRDNIIDEKDEYEKVAKILKTAAPALI